MEPKTKITIYCILQFPGTIILLISSFLALMGKPVEKSIPLMVIGCVLIVCSLFFFPRKKDYEEIKKQKS
jgi:C4-dicarboxylate transporter